MGSSSPIPQQPPNNNANFPEQRDKDRIARSMNTCSKCNRKRHVDQLAVRMNNYGNWTISCDDCAKQHGHRTRKELLGDIKIPDLSEHSKRVYKGEFLIK